MANSLYSTLDRHPQDINELHGGPLDNCQTTTFKVLDQNSSIDNLCVNGATGVARWALTINSQTVEPLVCYEGKNATADLWTATVGPNLVSVLSGTDPVVNCSTPFTDNTCKAVHFKEGKAYASDSSVTLGTNDIWFSVLFRQLKYITAAGDQAPFAIGGLPGETLTFISNSLDDGSAYLGYYYSQLNDATPKGVVFQVDTRQIHGWTLLDIMINRDEDSDYGFQGFVNGKLYQSGNHYVGKDWDLKGKVRTGYIYYYGGAYGLFHGFLAYASIHVQPNWFRAGADGAADGLAAHQERFYKLCGIWPSISKGTALPSFTRNSKAYLDINESGTITVHPVRPNWPRVVKRLDENNNPIVGYLAETEVYNYAVSSEVLGDTADQAIAPDNTITADRLTAIAGGTYERVFDGGQPNWGSSVHGIKIRASVWIKRVSGGTELFLGTTDRVTWSGQEITKLTITDTWARYDVVHTLNSPSGCPYCDVVLGIYNHATTEWVSDIEFDVWGLNVTDGNHPLFSYQRSIGGATGKPMDKLLYIGDDGNLGGIGSNKKGSINTDILIQNYNAILTQTIVHLYDNTDAASYVALQINPTDDVINLKIEEDGSSLIDQNGTIDVADGIQHNIKAQWKIGSNIIKTDNIVDGTSNQATNIPADLDVISIGYDGKNNDKSINVVIGNIEIKNK